MFFFVWLLSNEVFSGNLKGCFREFKCNNCVDMLMVEYEVEMVWDWCNGVVRWW